MVKVNAKLFEITHRFISTEDTRYYLNGVYIAPCAVGGVTLVATDEYRLFVAYDANGEIEEPAIIRAEKATLNACKNAKAEHLTFTPDEFSPVTAQILGTDGALAGSGIVTQIDGTYPDWRRVVPEAAGDVTGFFNAKYLKSFADAATALKATIRISGAEDARACDTALVTFSNGPVFGVIMPTRSNPEHDRDTIMSIAG